MNNNKSTNDRFNLKQLMNTEKSQLPPLSAIRQKIQYKKKIRLDFQKSYEDNNIFDSIIQTQYEKMLREKQETPSLIIPKNFEIFIKSKSFKQLLKKVYEYCQYLNQVLIKYKKLQNELKQRKGDYQLNFFKFQLNQLEQKCKQISFVYSGIILSQGDHRFIFKDQYFFQTMLYFLNQVMKESFDREEFQVIQQQISRIFRTNAFNLIKRRHEEDDFLKKYPNLRQAKNQAIASIINKITQRVNISKNTRYQQKQKNEIRPFSINISASKSIRSRSPIMSVVFPSQKQKLFFFNKEVREKSQYIKSHRFSQIDFQKKYVKQQ